eukprot:scaffold211821_cov43-Tisochrysis_lutea.AAC.2
MGEALGGPRAGTHTVVTLVTTMTKAHQAVRAVKGPHQPSPPSPMHTWPKVVHLDRIPRHQRKRNEGGKRRGELAWGKGELDPGARRAEVSQ